MAAIRLESDGKPHSRRGARFVPSPLPLLRHASDGPSPPNGGRSAARVRQFWDDAARRNSTWYLETVGSCAEPNMAEPNMERFFEAGRTIVSDALDRAPVRPRCSERAVEIGSGLGRNCVALAERFGEVVGLDVSPEMVARARALVRDRRISFLTGDGFSLRPIADASVDLVLSFTVFQHIPSVGVIESYLREAARVLRPGGVLAFQWNSEPGPAHWRMRRALLAVAERGGIRFESDGRNAAELRGCRVPVHRVQLVLQSSGLSTPWVRGEGTIFTWGWAQAP